MATERHIERRFVTKDAAPTVEGRHLSGQFAPFNSVTTIGSAPWGFREKIAPGAFKKSINDGDVVLLDNHDTSKPLARKSAGTLRVAEGSNGGSYDAEPSNTSYANDAIENIRTGNYGGCSFGFEVIRDSWEAGTGDEMDIRTLHEVKLHEISVVTFPAYSDTNSSVRDAVSTAMEARKVYFAKQGVDVDTDPEITIRAKDVEDLASQIKAAKTDAQKAACVALAKTLHCTKMIPDSWSQNAVDTSEVETPETPAPSEADTREDDIRMNALYAARLRMLSRD